MGLILEDLDGHEGHADRRLADGRLAGGVWSRDTLAWTANVAACGCDWHATREHPPTDEGEEAAVDHWRWAHAEPLLQQQAERRHLELARVLEWLGGQAGQLHDPATVDRVGRAVNRARGLVADVQRHLERPAQREADDAR